MVYTLTSSGLPRFSPVSNAKGSYENSPTVSKLCTPHAKGSRFIARSPFPVSMMTGYG